MVNMHSPKGEEKGEFLKLENAGAWGVELKY